MDPGFPVGGGMDPFLGRSVNLPRGCFLVKMYVKTKEFGPVEGGGACAGNFCM